MPRELVHWHIVRETLNHPKISSRPLLFSMLNREVHCAYIGALAHDVPYYYNAGHSPFERVADAIHGREGEDTFLPIRALTKEILRRPRVDQSSLWPLLFGMLSHMAGDIVFHPVIYYFTGNYHDPSDAERPRAQARHRLFEVYLDSWMRPQVQFEWGRRLKNLVLANRAQNNWLICDLLNSVLTPDKLWPEEFPKPIAASLWTSAIRQVGFYQQLFLSPLVGSAMRGVAAVSKEKLSGIDALFSFGRSDTRGLFDRALSYRNPVTGESNEASAHDLIAEAIDKTVEYICLFEPFLEGETDVDKILGSVVGPSLNFGTLHSKSEYALFFSESGFPLPGLQR